MQLIAGRGPICPGYVMLAPKKHIHTAAKLPDTLWAEFLAFHDVIVLALERQYGPGFTAYEHGQLGSCRIREQRPTTNTYCHHCHRVYIPVATACHDEIGKWFDVSHELNDRNRLRSLSDTPYVYYESQDSTGGAIRIAYEEGRAVPSQFMRRILTSRLKTHREYNWAVDARLEEMVSTYAALRAFFVGIGEVQPPLLPQMLSKLKAHVSIDGCSHAGKSLIADSLGKVFACPVLDTGLAYRCIAIAHDNGKPFPTAEELLEFIRNPASRELARSVDMSMKVRTAAADPDLRQRVQDLLGTIIASSKPHIIIGRNAWQLLGADNLHLIIEADFETRLARRILSDTCRSGECSDLEAIRKDLAAEDVVSYKQFPKHNTPGVITIYNHSRPLSAVLKQAIKVIEDHL